jgi:hypothetical protein
MRDTPRQLGLHRLGSDHYEVESASENPIFAALRALSQATRSPAFWLLSGSFFVCGASTNGLIGPTSFQLVSITAFRRFMGRIFWPRSGWIGIWLDLCRSPAWRSGSCKFRRHAPNVGRNLRSCLSGFWQPLHRRGSIDFIHRRPPQSRDHLGGVGGYLAALKTTPRARAC